MEMFSVFSGLDILVISILIITFIFITRYYIKK